MRCLCPLALAALASMATATNRPDILRAGFSPDGRYHLLLTAHLQDGSGFPTATLQVTNVRANTIALLVSRTDREGQNARTTAQQLMDAQRTVLNRYGLTRPLTGQRLFQKTFSGPIRWPQAQDAETLGTPSGVALVLRTFALPSTCDERRGRGLLPPGLTPSGLSLSVNGAYLQRDTRLPGSRACAVQYRLDTAWKYGQNIAVIVRAFVPGFEGPDMLPLVVTGRLR